MLRALLFLIILLSFNMTFAGGTDVIAWKTTSKIPAKVLVGQTQNQIYVFTNQAPFTLPTPIFIEKETLNTAEFSFFDHCSGLFLAPHQNCSVVVRLVAITTGAKEAALSIGYGNNLVPLPTISVEAY